MFEIVRPQRRPLSAKELARQLADLSAAAAERQAQIDAITGLAPEVLRRTAALTALEETLASAVPTARDRLAFVTNLAVAAMAEIAAKVDR
jgi:hypothetical protein